MIDMDQAMGAVDRRLAAALGDTHGLATVGLTCAASPVDGPALLQRIYTDALFVETLAKRHGIRSAATGVLLQTFWLGYEFGRAAE